MKATAIKKRQIRCAIYTRKSSEEGLEQSFNSLDAQREACEAYIASQRHEGWTVIKTKYDDGGFSGGTMDRPALKLLLEDIGQGKVDAVVVYKVDRLTRSLSDFAKIIEAFDSRDISFVSVTQQFNTTTSMGRLTLNVLLSFAQFEREVTGERIRDKIAASKKKGMWMGGNVAVGYDLGDRKLLVNKEGAKLVREIFEQYLRLGCVAKLKADLEQRSLKSPIRTSSTGRKNGGRVFSRGALYQILKNPLYLGDIRHRGQIYRGEHEAIIDRRLWEKVAAKLKANNQSHRERRTSPSSPSPLTGLLFDAAGFRYTPTHAVKAGKRYRYYTSQAAIRRVSGATGIPRIPAHDIEKIVKTRIQSLLAAPGPLLNGSRRSPEAEAFRDAARRKAKTWPKLSGVEQNEFLRKVARRVVLGQSTLLIRLSRQAVIQAVTGSSPDHMARRDRVAAGTHDTFELTCEMRAMQHAGVVHLEPADEKGRAEPMRSTSLIKAIARARMWYEKLLSGDVQTFRTLAAQTGMTQRYISRILKCALLAPELVEAVLDGRQPAEMSLERLTTNMPLAWSAQTRCWQGARFHRGM
jgi:DNA invertase Pin-like site-specific DNA recombinase